METMKWIADAIPRRTLAVRQRSVDELTLPPIDGAFGALVITFDPTLRHSRAKELEDAIMDAGAHVLPDVGGPGAESWHGEFWIPDLEWSRSPARAIEHFFDSSIVGMGMTVTSFVVLAVDADDADWREVLEATQTVLDARPDWRLHAAADAGRSSEVRQAIAGGWPIDDFDDTGHTPLHNACVKGHLDVMKLLIDAGADVNRRCEELIGDTPLGEVADTCSLEVARVLIDSGADPTIPGWMALTALDRAASRTDDQGKAVFALLQASSSRRAK